ncbi:Methyltransferase domain family [Synechococcus sp. PCC 7335]|uniref:class I SAM-dependent methyltransferase n=1 Tax=Synechococcus sp. (strain ATCC 29403 / PCC 7335) TaxID=91464 RepID=UPI00017EBC96|nr:class I SAM-dependent methyltransferase [Synechococcus sp. PCC 7335]EDX84430.1 Methyltransferase domain family [Synechococcus sp. PCC 7335]
MEPKTDLSEAVRSPQLSPHHSWNDYYQAVAARPPRETLVMALDAFAAELSPPIADKPRSDEPIGFAVDLGCGNGRDTVELLQRNWSVLGIDGEPEAIGQLRQRQDADLTLLTTQIQRFETLDLPNNVDLINASFCLPFCPPDYFPTLWEKIVTALRPGGRFCGHLFGDRDDWRTYPNRSHHTRSQVEQLLLPFDIELLDEEEHPGKTALAEEKYWHLFNIVARRQLPT